MTRTETENKKNINSVENNLSKIEGLLKTYPNAFRKGIDIYKKPFLITRLVENFPNIIITEKECIAIMGMTPNRNSVPLNIDEDHMSEIIFNLLPQIFSTPGRFLPKSSDILLFFHEYKNQHGLSGFKEEIFQLQNEDKERFVNNMAFLSEQKYRVSS